MINEIRGVLYVNEWDMKELMKDRNYQRIEIPEPQHRGYIGIYLTPYNRLEVVLLRDKCYTCANYKPINE